MENSKRNLGVLQSFADYPDNTNIVSTNKEDSSDTLVLFPISGPHMDLITGELQLENQIKFVEGLSENVKLDFKLRENKITGDMFQLISNPSEYQRKSYKLENRSYIDYRNV